MQIRAATLDDTDTIKQIAVATQMFGRDETGFFDEMISGALDGSMEGHRWLVAQRAAGAALGAAYYAPEPFADRVWNLHFIAVDPNAQGAGIGSSLVAQVVAELREMGPSAAQVLLVETSSTDQYTRTREFYPQHGFVEEARLRRFYGPNDDKVVFWKSLTEE